jgi:hypothetical protein
VETLDRDADLDGEATHAERSRMLAPLQAR